MSERERAAGEASPEASAPSPAGTGEPRYEPAPGVGRLLLWALLFVLAAVAVVLGGVYLT